MKSGSGSSGMAQSGNDSGEAPASAEGSRERVTVSSVPISRESRVTGHDVTKVEVEAAWLDRLVVAACEMPVASGEAAVVEFLVRALGEIFPRCGVGACYVPPAPSQLDVTLPIEQQLFKYVPEGEEARGVGMDPTRLFP